MSADDRYRRAAAAGGVGIWDWNLATNEIYVDPILKQILGYEDREIRNHIDDWGRVVHPDDGAAVFASAQAHIAGETPLYEIEHRVIHRDGSIRWFLARGSVTRDAAGVAVSMAGTDTDITERKRGEEALRQAEEINRRIAEHTGDCVKILDLEGRLVYMNREGLRFLEVEMADVLNCPMVGFFKGEMRAAAAAAVAEARAGGCGRFQGLLRARSGPERWWDIAVTPITGVDGAVVQLLAVSRDITERRRDEAVRAAQQHVLGMIAGGSALTDVLECLVRLVEQQSDGMLCSVIMLDEPGARVRHCAAPSLPADYVRAVDGLTIGPKHGSCGTSMFLGAPVIVTDILCDPLWEDYRELARQAGFRSCWSVPIGSPQRKPIGSFAMYYAEPRSPSDAELRLIESGADIARIAIEHDRASEALRASEARNRAMLRAIPDWMFLTTTDGVFLDYHASDTSRLYLPPSAFLGKRVTEVLPPAVGELLTRAFARVSASDESEQVEYVLGSEESERFYEAYIVRCDGDKILSIVRDVTDRKRNEIDTDAHRRELAHLSRVATLGELTGALAHELSQPLTAVRANAQAAWHLLGREPLDRMELCAALDDIIRNNRRAGAVIDRLRALLRKESTAFQPVDVNDVVRDVIDLAHSEIVSRRIRLTSRLAPAMPVVQGDRIQLQQVLLNLVLNACDAMSEAGSSQRQLVLTTALTDGFVQLAVSDGGPGIPESQLERVFEPFVTFRQQGLGLGLAISRSIVTDHGGSISAENNPGGGATFRCLLPVARVTTNA
jgi:PAS domain S-box-containing protein